MINCKCHAKITKRNQIFCCLQISRINYLFLHFRTFPNLKWAQRRDKVYITIDILDIEKTDIDLNDEKFEIDIGKWVVVDDDDDEGVDGIELETGFLWAIPDLRFILSCSIALFAAISSFRRFVASYSPCCNSRFRVSLFWEIISSKSTGWVELVLILGGALVVFVYLGGIVLEWWEEEEEEDDDDDDVDNVCVPPKGVVLGRWESW